MIKIDTFMQQPKSIICSMFSFCFFQANKSGKSKTPSRARACRVYANSHTLLPTQQEVLIEANVSRNVKFTIWEPTVASYST